MSIACRSSLLVVSSAALPALLACLDHPLKSAEYDRQSEIFVETPLSINRNVDVLLVIDNSGSMGEEQENLAANFENFLAVLEAPDVQANYRIGITTTDVGGCGNGPEAGRLVLSSCLERLGDFTSVSDGANNEQACTANCTLDEIPVVATPTKKDDDAKPRPWIEGFQGRTNLQSGVTPLQALQCAGPQGTNGCGFESPLEAMFLALERDARDTEASHGFLRDDAILAVVFVTDEVDCSYNPDYFDTLFNEHEGRVFWSDPETPTSAICWNAGVKCEGGNAEAWGTCEPADYDAGGKEISGPTVADDAMLHPLSRYIDRLKQIDAFKQQTNAGQRVLVAAITGVPQSYPESPVDYIRHAGNASKSTFVTEFGVGPGCVSDVAEAVPPVRMKAFAEEFALEGEPNLFSVCNTNYGPALEAIAEQIRRQLRPGCVDGCVADVDPTTPELDPSCTVKRIIEDDDGNKTKEYLPPCEDGELPEDADACFVAVTGNDLHQECKEHGYNLEFRIVEDPDKPTPEGKVTMEAGCQLSERASLECPDMG